MATRFLTILTGRNLPKIRQQAEPSTINNKTVADFIRVVEQTGILDERGPRAPDARRPEE
jgi:DNA-binding transcriptional regulator YhcF (GntR family)